jgi:hypothetical protein
MARSAYPGRLLHQLSREHFAIVTTWSGCACVVAKICVMLTLCMFAAGVGGRVIATIWAALALGQAKGTKASNVEKDPHVLVRVSLSTRPANKKY